MHLVGNGRGGLQRLSVSCDKWCTAQHAFHNGLQAGGVRVHGLPGRAQACPQRYAVA